MICVAFLNVYRSIQPSTHPAVTLTIYTDVFTQIGLVTLGVTVLMAVTAPLLNRLITRTDAEDAEPVMEHE